MLSFPLSFPLTFGGGDDTVEQEMAAMADAMRPGYDVEDAFFDAENHAVALGIAMIWDSNARLENQAIPARMQEDLPVWEQILNLSPPSSTSEQERRRAVAGRLRGQGGNTMTDIEDVSRLILGQNYIEVRSVDPVDQYVWWPAGSPGPPGFEWSSNRCHVCVAMTRYHLTDDELAAKMQRLHDTLDAMLPVWMTFDVGVENPDDLGFLSDVDTCDIDLL